MGILEQKLKRNHNIKIETKFETHEGLYRTEDRYCYIIDKFMGMTQDTGVPTPIYERRVIDKVICISTYIGESK